MRQRVVWAEAATNSGWHFYGGQMWSLAAERAKLLSNLSGDVMTPQTIDPNYAVGFQWTRQYGFRVVKDFGKKAALGVSIENAQLLTGGTGGANTVSVNAGTGGGLYNLNATYSFNQAPDLIAKLAVDPGFGHYEVYGIGRFIHQRVYPSVAGQYTNTDLLSGIGGSFRVPVAGKFATLGVSGLWGQGMGRYGDTTLADVTFKPDGEFAPLHNASALGTLELHPNARLTIYGNYGIDYASRKWYTGTDGKQYGYGNPFFSNTGCNTESAPTGGPNSPTSPGSCSGNTRNVQEAIAGWWYDFYRGPKGRLRQGFQYSYVVRQTWNGLASSTSNGQPKAIENMFFTSFRYYLP
jgi:hypothetical protein